jgi:arylsulfatase A-like enzyme
MSDSRKRVSPSGALQRREFLKRSAAAVAAPSLCSAVAGSEPQADPSSTKKKQPNVILYISDQFRWDALGAYGLNGLGLTPNLDAMARRGTLFRSHVTNQPVCAPSRTCLFTGQYQNRHEVWMNGLAMSPSAVTLATALRQVGYTANYIGKWHLAPNSGDREDSFGPVPREYRGGFLDVWEAANVLEFTSHSYAGTIWDADRKPIQFSGVYRVDFLTDRAVRFLQSAREPFLLVISQVEPHFQNDCNCFIAPRGYADRYANPFVPQDLRFFPGDWQKQLPNYYGCIASIDDSVGGILRALAQRGIEDNTIVAFLSDHGCHFRTRNSEYKRSPHESSIHIPLVVQGPGFDRSMEVPELTSQIDVTPTLLDAVGVPIPNSMQGRSAMPLLDRKTDGWRNEAYIQISESQIGRALRTPEWTYAVVAPRSVPLLSPRSDVYEEYQMYNLFDDPHQLLNLAGREDPRGLVHFLGDHSMKGVAEQLREQLQAKMTEAGESPARIEARTLYP